MTDEERQRTMDFILAQQAQFWASIQKLEASRAKHEESHAQIEETQRGEAVKTNLHDHLMDRLERILKLVVRAGLRERKQTRERMEALRESQAHSDKRLDVLIDIVREQRNGTA